MGGEMMSRYLFEFLSNRISFAFIMIFLMLFLELRCSWLISVLTAVFAYLSEFMLGYMCYFTDFGKHHQVLFTAASILLIQGVAFLLGSYRDFRTVFTAVSGSGFIVLGTTMGTVTFLYTRDAVIGLVVVALVQSLIMAGLVVTMRKPYLETMKQSGRYWKALCLFRYQLHCADLAQQPDRNAQQRRYLYCVLPDHDDLLRHTVPNVRYVAEGAEAGRGQPFFGYIRRWTAPRDGDDPRGGGAHRPLAAPYVPAHRGLRPGG